MTLNILSVGDNPQQPGIVAETYIPDQLIAGNLKLVTDNVTVTGAATIPRGTIMGLATVGTGPVATAGKVHGSGTITVNSVPTAAALAGTETVTLGNGVGSTAITFLAAPAGQVEEVVPPNTIYVYGTSTTATLAAALTSLLNGSTDQYLSLNTYSLSGSVVTATAKIPGTGGNAYTLATTDSTAFTVSGATFSGGTNNTGTATIGSISFGVAAIPGNYLITLISATQGTVVNPNGDVLGTATMGTAFTNPEINFTLTTGGSPAAGDAFEVTTSVLPMAGLAKVCIATAVDGSDVPYGVLVDYCDPTSGNVNAGVYLMGEFNANAIIYDSSWSVPALKVACARSGMFFKTAVTAGDPS
jgi:Bacteriophage lambda head decoration protein D